VFEFALLTFNEDIQELKQTIKLNTALMLFKNKPKGQALKIHFSQNN
jgi:hypothetical protein